MLIPDKVKVGSITYQVKQEHIDKTDDGLYQFGVTDYLNAVITINSDYPQERKEQTFFHELMHAVFFESSNSDQAADERLVDSTGLMLYQVFKENELANLKKS
ncbi:MULTISPECIES: ImmA/IrrE family metallo-endopeptidase [Lapidilactobacillus]|uniref:ImmA/IrrE family metallo-endopeptidase n=2 Tax=Lapidilactobacillus TaxID=2767884 RepID=A0ABW1UMJ8_9LACO|nr:MULTISPECIES: ImmA/IrrE family metallo-endopeptidase [Lapidilactobacillus]